MKQKLIPMRLHEMDRNVPVGEPSGTRKMAGTALKTLVGMVAMVGMLSPAQALTFTLNQSFSDPLVTPQNTYTATLFDNCGADCVQLTMTITGTSTTEFIDGGSANFGWGFNFDPLLSASLTSLNFTHVSGNDADSIQKSANNFKADGDGDFDILFGWDAATTSRFTLGSVVYNITGITGLDAADFNFASFCEQGCGNGSFFSAAHVQGIGDNGALSVFIGDGDGGLPPVIIPPVVIPEPASLALLGLGLASLAAIRRRRVV